MKYSLLVLLMATTVMAWAQTDLVYPWVTNNANFRGTVIINNLNTEQVQVDLTATRPAGNDPQTAQATLMLSAFEQRVVTAADLFPDLGDGQAFTIRLTSTASNIEGGFINVGTQSSTGSSPSQANVLNASDASNVLLFNYMFIDDAQGFSAPVVVNMGDTTADVNFYAYQNGMQVSGPVTFSVEAGTPFADVAANLAPGVTGDIMLVAESSNSLLGTVFVFNPALEPSMADAVSLMAVPDPNGGGSFLTYTEVYEAVIQRSCSGGACHAPGNAGSLNLDPSNFTSNLIDAQGNSIRAGLSGRFRVIPGDPDNSYLYQKLFNDGNFAGSRMPIGRPELSDSEKDLIRQWILDGANQ